MKKILTLLISIITISLFGNDRNYQNSKVIDDPNAIWTEKYGKKEGFLNQINDFVMDSQGNIFTVGTTTELGYLSMRIMKVTSSGVTVWNKIISKIHGGAWEMEGHAIVLDSTGNIYIGGFAYNYISDKSKHDWVIKKINPQGTEITTGWDKVYDGDLYDDEIKTMVIDNSNNLFVGGYGTNLTSSNSLEDYWVKKFDLNGTEALNREIKLDLAGRNDVVNSLIVDSSNYLYIGGTVVDHHDTKDYFGQYVMKLNGSGEMIKYIYTNVSSSTSLRALAIDNAKGFLYTAGSYNSKGIIRKYKLSDFSEISLNINISYGLDTPNTRVNSIDFDTSGNLFATGISYFQPFDQEESPYEPYIRDVIEPFSWVLKFNSSGQQIVEYIYEELSYSNRIKLKTDGIYIGGSTKRHYSYIDYYDQGHPYKDDDGWLKKLKSF